MTEYFLSMTECLAKPVVTVATNVIDFRALAVMNGSLHHQELNHF